MKYKRKSKVLLFVILLVAISIGFAALSATLKINGTANFAHNEWNIYWDNVGNINKTSNVVINSPASVDVNDNTKVNFSIVLDKPGDYYEFQVDAVNAGTIDAMLLDDISVVVNDDEDFDLPDYIKFSVTYLDGSKPVKYHLLEKAKNNIPTTERYKIRVEFDRNIENEDLPSTGANYSFYVELPYGQADDNAIANLGWFGNASWDEIIDTYEDGDPDGKIQYAMEHNKTKTITLNDGSENGIQAKLRIANNSTPNECKNGSVSETACGLVLEFADYVGQHIYNYFDMDYYTSHGYQTRLTEGGNGGWEFSNVRAYLNGGVYTSSIFGDEDFAGHGFIDTLPNDLRSKIIDTNVISGHGARNSSNYSTIDKIYLLDAKEIYGDSFTDQYNTAKNSQRQLDYYRTLGVTTTTNKELSCKGDIVLGKDVWWGWLRSATMQWDANLYVVDILGDVNTARSNDEASISPAFRIAE